MSGPLQTDCIVCRNRLIAKLTATERMFGMGGRFEYGCCTECGMLSLLNPPEAIGKYYPPNSYYSFATPTIRQWHTSFWIRWLANKRNSAQLFGSPAWGVPLARKRPSSLVTSIKDYFKHVASHRGLDLRILDVGCGGGQLLQELASIGFRRLQGIDPYLRAQLSETRSVGLRKAEIYELVNERYDLIFFNHSLEHMRDHRGALEAANRLLSKDGVVRVEIPVADCDAFTKYGANWIELDPPRHLHLHTRESLRRLASQCGLRVIEINECGGGFEFWGSEMYTRNISYVDAATSQRRNPDEIFSTAECKEFEQLGDDAKKLFRSGRIAAFLEASPSTG